MFDVPVPGKVTECLAIRKLFDYALDPPPIPLRLELERLPRYVY